MRMRQKGTISQTSRGILRNAVVMSHESLHSAPSLGEERVLAPRRGPGAGIGQGIARLRDGLAMMLVRAGATPNMLTVLGFILTAVAAVGLFLGAGHAPPWERRIAPTTVSYWPLTCAIILTLSFSCDMLDGAMAQTGRLRTPFGALLDSTLDRWADALMFFACALHFATLGHLTYVVLSLAGAAHAALISYIKARAENLIDSCRVGFWQRGERCGVLGWGALTGHIPAALWILGTLPLLTAVTRLRHAHARITGREPTVRRGRLPWHQPRGSAGYDLCIGTVLGFVLAAPWWIPFLYGASDPLGVWLRAWVMP